MSIIDRRGSLGRPDIRKGLPTDIARNVLLGCGVVSSLLYPVANDVLAAGRYEGYSSFSDTISELSAIGAPSRQLLVPLIVLYEVLLIAFGIGVWQAAQGKRTMRGTASLIIAFGAVGLLGLFFPISQPGGLATEPTTPLMHLVLSGWVPPLIMFSAIGFGAAALGKRFRLYSILTVLVVLLGGAWAGMDAARVAAGGSPSPWTGLTERINIWPWLLWVAVLAIVLLRARRTVPSHQS